MKCVVDISELEQMFRAKHNLPDTVNVEINGTPRHTANPAPAATTQHSTVDPKLLVSVVNCLNNRDTSNKIPAIKIVRTFLNNALAEAKWIIENWEEYCRYINAYNRIPVLISRSVWKNGVITNFEGYILA